MTTRVCTTICHTASLTFAGCPLQLYLLRMFCSSARRKISFRTWFSQMFFNKSLIMCEKFVSCLMQYSEKYWKWPETYALFLDSYWTPQFRNFAIPDIWLSSHSITMLFALDICVNKKAPPTQCVLGSQLPPPTSKT